jgi:hypothetical protein
MAARQTIQPVSLNALALSGGTFPSAPSAGIDAAGTGGSSFATAWAGINGVQFTNNGHIWLWYYNGADACTAYALVGQKAAGQVLPYATYSYTLNTSGYGWLGPWDAAQFNQEDSTQFAGGSGGSSPGGVIGTAAIGMMCVDFSVTTTLAIRAYQMLDA